LILSNKLTGKQRAALRSMLQRMEPVLYVGKGGVTPNVVRQADDALTARELIKGSVRQNSGASAWEVCDDLCGRTGAQAVSVLGRKFALYRESPEKKDRIEI
jgi:RNA-binding protein